MLIAEFPAVIGSDTCGVVIETGEGCTKLKTGDYTFGCVPIGLNKFSPFQETFIVNEDWMFKVEQIKPAEGSTIGSGVLVRLIHCSSNSPNIPPSPEHVRLKMNFRQPEWPSSKARA
jgi:hypothetical protein